MLGEYKVNRCTRRCYAEDRPLREGEYYYSVVIESGDDYERRDYSASAWSAPPERAVGWWKNRMPKSTEKKVVLAPNEVLVDLLRQMAHFPDKAASRYLLALMLMRRKIVRPSNVSPQDALLAEETTTAANEVSAGTPNQDSDEAIGDEKISDQETDDQNTAENTLDLPIAKSNGNALGNAADISDAMVVEVVADGSLIVIPSCRISRQQSETLRNELHELLYCEAEEEA